jgi:hypothetical protein
MGRRVNDVERCADEDEVDHGLDERHSAAFLFFSHPTVNSAREYAFTLWVQADRELRNVSVIVDGEDVAPELFLVHRPDDGGKGCTSILEAAKVFPRHGGFVPTVTPFGDDAAFGHLLSKLIRFHLVAATST